MSTAPNPFFTEPFFRFSDDLRDAHCGAVARTDCTLNATCTPFPGPSGTAVMFGGISIGPSTTISSGARVSKAWNERRVDRYVITCRVVIVLVNPF